MLLIQLPPNPSVKLDDVLALQNVTIVLMQQMEHIVTRRCAYWPPLVVEHTLIKRIRDALEE